MKMMPRRSGRESNYRNHRRENNSNRDKEINKGSDNRGLVGTDPRDISSCSKLAGFTTSSNLLYGLNEEVDIGLKVDNCKRRRGEMGIMDVDLGLNKTGQLLVTDRTETVISETDLTVSSQTIQAKLAQQASRSS